MKYGTVCFILAMLLVFGPEGYSTGWVPGELLIKLTPDAVVPDGYVGTVPTVDMENAWVELGIETWEKIIPYSTSDPVVGRDRWYKLRFPAEYDLFERLDRLLTLPGIETAHLNGYLQACEIPNDPDYDQFQWSLQTVQADKAWDITHGSTDTVIAIIDSGTDMDHVDLTAAIWHNTADPINGMDDDSNGYVDDYNGWDFYGNDNNPDNVLVDNMHGTHVAGISGAVTNNGVGIAGSSWGCPLMICKVFPDAGGGAPAGDVAEAIYYAADNGAAVMNLSLGGPDFQVERDAVAYAVNQGVVVVAAAGNGGTDGLGDMEPHYPSAYDQVIGVGNTNKFDQKNSSSNYSNEHVDVFAPGTSIRSTIPNNEYKAEQGTSMSSPLVAGQAGLMLSAYPWMNIQNVTDRIRYGCDNIDEQNPLWRGQLSAGRINFYNSITEGPVLGVHQVIVQDATGNANHAADSGEQIDLDISLMNHSWTGGTDITATLSVTSGPASVIDDTAFYGDMITKEIKKNADPLTLQIGSTRASEIILDLHVQDGIIYDDHLEITLPVDEMVPPLPGFPKNATAEFYASPKVADLDGDGDLEIVTACNDGLIRIWTTEGIYYPGWPVLAGSDQPNDTHLILSAPAIADLDLDGNLDIIVADYITDQEYINNDPERRKHRILGSIYAYHSNGTAMDGFPLTITGAFAEEPDAPEQVGFKSSPCIADVYGDAHPEIVVGNYGNMVYVIRWNGSLISGWPKDVGTDVFATAAVGDLEGDGQQEIIIATKADTDPMNSGRIYVFDGSGSVIPGFPIEAPNQVYSAPVLVDLDGNGDLEIVYGYGDFYEEYPNHGITAIHHDGSTMAGWPSATNTTIYGSPGIGDLDGDGRPDIVTGDYQGYVYAFDAGGDLLPGWPVQLMSQKISSSPIIADLDHQGGPEILMGIENDQTGKLFVLHSDATIMTSFDLDKNGFAAPVVADLDNDGDLEIVMNALSTYIYNLSGSYNPSMQYWTTYRGNNCNDGRYESGAANSGINLILNQDNFTGGDTFRLDSQLNNAGGAVEYNIDLFIVLDVYGAYWFYPSWSDQVDWLDIPNLDPGSTLNNIFNFTWPQGNFGSAQDLIFWGAILDESGTLYGQYDFAMFGYYS
ncbi:S8 family serine peptidase [bacterium]|nr:S8 family serine peptidase [candidate division CSSED10-310 bacterium]